MHTHLHTEFLALTSDIVIDTHTYIYMYIHTCMQSGISYTHIHTYMQSGTSCDEV
jgi:hypothetical protein